MIRPVEFNAMLQRTDDVGQMKHHEDQKPVMDQQAIQGQVLQKEHQLSHKVIQPHDSSAMENHADARDEGKNKYENNRKKKTKQESGKVIKKQPGTGFDFKV